jgi:hypothetical protein
VDLRRRVPGRSRLRRRAWPRRAANVEGEEDDAGRVPGGGRPHCQLGSVRGPLFDYQGILKPELGLHRYDSLYLYGNVNIHYKADEGTFKCSGSYGVPPKGGI